MLRKIVGEISVDADSPANPVDLSQLDAPAAKYASGGVYLAFTGTRPRDVTLVENSDNTIGIPIPGGSARLVGPLPPRFTDQESDYFHVYAPSATSCAIRVLVGDPSVAFAVRPLGGSVGTDSAGVAVVDVSLTDDARTIYDLETSPAGPAVLDYQPAGEAGVALDDADEAAVLVELNVDARRRTTLVDVATLADSEAYGLTVDGASDTRTSDADATEAEVLELLRELVAGLSKPVWAHVENVDDDGNDELRVEELWSKFSPSSVSNDTEYAVDITYRDGWTTTTETISYQSAPSSEGGATEDGIVQGLRDAFNAADAPVHADVEDGNSDGTDDVCGVEPDGETDVSFSAGSSVTQDASHSSDPRGDLSVSDNSGGANADLRVLQEATSATFTVWARHRSGAWVRVNNLSGRKIGANWSEVIGSLGNYDRLYVEFTSVDGRVGARVAPAIGGQ